MRRWSYSILVLVITVAVVLTACAEDQAATSTQPSTTGVTVGQTTLTLESTAVSQTTTTTASTTTTTLQEPVTFKLASPFSETEPGGLVVQRFVELIEERTNEAIKFDLYPEGILGDPDEVLALLETGGVDLALVPWETMAHALPLLDFPGFPPGDRQEALAYCNHLVFENPETSALIHAEAQAHRLRYLGFVSLRANTFVSSVSLSSLADLEGKKCAAVGFISALQTLGVEVVQSPLSGTYEELSTGSVDCAYGGFLSAVRMKWFEVAPFMLFDGMYMVDDLWSMNTRAWSRLRPETQMVFVKTAEELETWSSELVQEEEQKALANLEAGGVTVGTLASEDQKLWWGVVFKAEADALYELARRGGFVRDAVTILEAAAEFSGADWSVSGR